MKTFVIGCNHRSASVEQRERIAFGPKGTERALVAFKEKFPDAELVLVSTCNRTELYVAQGADDRPCAEDLIAFVAGVREVDASELANLFYVYEELDATRHLFRVASSLDSMVLGESEVLGQVREAYKTALHAGTVGASLGPLFQDALATAREVRTTTDIATGRVSIGSTAVDLARQIFAHFDDKNVLMIGTGKMGELTLAHLLETRPKRLIVTNRTAERAEDLASRLREKHDTPIEVVPFEDRIAQFARADIAISCTGSCEPIVTGDAFRPVPELRRYRPLLLIDIAVPRDIDASLDEHDCVYLYNIDDLQSVTEQSLSRRREAVSRCQEIIEAAALSFTRRRSRPELGSLIAALESHFQSVSRDEMQRLLPKLTNVTPHDRELIEQMLHRITKKLLHHPVARLRRSQADSRGDSYPDMIRELFDLKDNPNPPEGG